MTKPNYEVVKRAGYLQLFTYTVTGQFLQVLGKNLETGKVDEPIWKINQTAELASQISSGEITFEEGNVILESETIQAKNGEIGKLQIAFNEKFGTALKFKVSFGDKTTNIELIVSERKKTIYLLEFLLSPSSFTNLGFSDICLNFISNLFYALPNMSQISLDTTQEIGKFYIKPQNKFFRIQGTNTYLRTR